MSSGYLATEQNHNLKNNPSLKLINAKIKDSTTDLRNSSLTKKTKTITKSTSQSRITNLNNSMINEVSSKKDVIINKLTNLRKKKAMSIQPSLNTSINDKSDLNDFNTNSKTNNNIFSMQNLEIKKKRTLIPKIMGKI